jgi:hypothetical protein
MILRDPISLGNAVPGWVFPNWHCGVPEAYTGLLFRFYSRPFIGSRSNHPTRLRDSYLGPLAGCSVVPIDEGREEYVVIELIDTGITQRTSTLAITGGIRESLRSGGPYLICDAMGNDQYHQANQWQSSSNLHIPSRSNRFRQHFSRASWQNADREP